MGFVGNVGDTSSIEKHDIKELSNEEFLKIEVEANQFAASFLLPKNAFFEDLVNPTNLDAYLQLKKK